MISTSSSVIVFCAINAGALEDVLKYGIRRKSLGWEDFESRTRYEPIEVYTDQQVLLDQSGQRCSTIIEVLLPTRTPYDSRGFKWLVHTDIDPSSIRGYFEYCKCYNEAGV